MSEETRNQDGFRPSKCSRCGSSHIWKHSVQVTVKRGKVQRWKCADCGHVF